MTSVNSIKNTNGLPFGVCDEISDNIKAYQRYVEAHFREHAAAAIPRPATRSTLRIEHDQGVVEIVVYNRAILLFTTDSAAVRRNSPGVLDITKGRREA